MNESETTPEAHYEVLQLINSLNQEVERIDLLLSGEEADLKVNAEAHVNLTAARAQIMLALVSLEG